MQKCDDGIRIGVAEPGTQLGGTHDRDSLSKIPNLAGVEVRRSQRNIPERRGLEGIFVSRCPRYSESSLVIRGKDLGTGLLNDTEWKIALSPQVHAGMAVAAAL